MAKGWLRNYCLPKTFVIIVNRFLHLTRDGENDAVWETKRHECWRIYSFTYDTIGGSSEKCGELHEKSNGTDGLSHSNECLQETGANRWQAIQSWAMEQWRRWQWSSMLVGKWYAHLSLSDIYYQVFLPQSVQTFCLQENYCESYIISTIHMQNSMTLLPWLHCIPSTMFVLASMPVQKYHINPLWYGDLITKYICNEWDY